MAGSDMDEILSMISDDTGDTRAKAPSSQQSLRDRMLNENRADAMRQEAQQKEQELSEEIIEEEEDEEYGSESGNKKKIIVIVCAIVFALICIIVIVASLAGKGKDKEVEEQSTEVVEQPVYDDFIIEEEPVQNFLAVTYDFEQVQQLRAAGATQEQIDEWQVTGVDYNYVYLTMLDRYYGWQLSNVLPTYDMASPEYKAVIDQTWMSLPLRSDIAEWTEDKYLAYSYDAQQNLDYEKIPPYGNQLFLKVYLDADTHDSWFFLNITPQEWNMLDDSGNVVVDYTYETHWLPFENQIDAVEDKENIFITSATLNIIESNKNLQNKNNDMSGSIIE